MLASSAGRLAAACSIRRAKRRRAAVHCDGARACIARPGRILEGTGVIPDEIVALTISDLRQGRDAALAAAEDALRVKRRNP